MLDGEKGNGCVTIMTRSKLHFQRNVESEILGFGILNTAQGIRNPTNDWNPESKFY